MQKKVFTVFLSLVLLCLMPLAAFSASTVKEIKANQLQSAAIFIDGKEVVCKDAQGNQMYPIEYNGVVYVPLKTVESASGKTAAWDAVNNKISVTSPAANAEAARTIYWVPNGKSYHFSDGCNTLSRSKTILSGTLEKAIAEGKDDPCNICAGGK